MKKKSETVFDKLIVNLLLLDYLSIINFCVKLP